MTTTCSSEFHRDNQTVDDSGGVGQCPEAVPVPRCWPMEMSSSVGSSEDHTYNWEWRQDSVILPVFTTSHQASFSFSKCGAVNDRIQGSGSFCDSLPFWSLPPTGLPSASFAPPQLNRLSSFPQTPKVRVPPYPSTHPSRSDQLSSSASSSSHLFHPAFFHPHPSLHTLPFTDSSSSPSPSPSLLPPESSLDPVSDLPPPLSRLHIVLPHRRSTRGLSSN
ncbi:uncharacterized protein BJX67DRAFT_169379 [Aspergillus lucknowensis]|uniref:Uncharacterized protein n=1 Tax=Aspergillus lucknowensis TaxID=176173 RepID=A0ABR4LM93_9EURO